MKSAALGEGVTRLPWLSPGAAALVALARSSPTAAWVEVRLDPGAVLLVLRQAAGAFTLPALSFYPTLLHEPSICEGALQHLDQPGFADWNHSAARSVYRAALLAARVANLAATRTGRCDPENAWVAGLLAPLGWLAVCALDSGQAAACLADPEFARNPRTAQERHWGLDASTIARRLARHWRLPAWLTAILGHLGLPSSTARNLGADPDLFHVTQLAIGLTQQQGAGLGLPLGATSGEAAAALGLAAPKLEALEHEAHELASQELPARTWDSPRSQPLLRDLLSVALEHRRLLNAPLVNRLEDEVDDLHRALEEHHAGQAEQLQARKLSALAEFAAGAGHEINNPLAVISGQAQYLLRQEENPQRQQCLQVVIAQAQRIHETLRELMQFARPPRPQKEEIELRGLVCEVLTTLCPVADERKVRLLYPEPQPALLLHADPAHLRTALTSLVRNAIEAAGADGWAAVRLEKVGNEQVDVVVEDSGRGPEGQQREHLFDPFYSGRPAGRGRGFGLPTAWRLARQHGGDVRFAGQPGGPTRFVLTLPRVNGANGTEN